MTDINAPAPPTPSQPPRQDPDEHGATAAVSVPNDLVNYAELLFFAYRDFTADADAILMDYGFGRAHHRVLHFVARTPGLRVAALLEILNITKQSMARVLKQLVDEGFVIQKAGKHDRRERLLYPTAQGAELANRLSELQARRIAQALADAGPQAKTIVMRFLFGMIQPEKRRAVDALLAKSTNTVVAGGPQDEG